MQLNLVILATLALPLAAVAQVAPGEDLPGTQVDIEGIDVTGGNLVLRRASYVRAGTGKLAVLSGVLRVGGPTGRAAITGGSITLSDDSTLTTSGSSLQVSGGNLQFRAASTFRGVDSAISLERGSALGFDASTFRLGNGSLTFTDDSAASFVDSALTVSGGSLAFRGKTGAQFDTASTLSINDGSLELSDAATLRLDGGSAFEVRGGSIVLANASTLEMNGGSTFSVGGGSLRLAPGTGLVFGERASSRTTRVDVLSSGAISFRPGSDTQLVESTVTLEPLAELQVDEDAVLTGRGTTLTVPDKAVTFDDLAALDAACAGTAVLTIDRSGVTGLFCDRPAAVGEQCKGYPVKDGSESGWRCRDACEKRIALACRD